MHKKMFITSDFHLGHKNIIKHTNRPYSSIEEMDDDIITKWNSTVKDTDMVLFLGDFIMSHRIDLAYNYLSKLNGLIYIVPGNHDKWTTKYLDTFKQSKVAICGGYKELKYNGVLLVLCHYPLLSWNNMRHGSIMLHGHSHGTYDSLNKGTRRLDVGWDAKFDGVNPNYRLLSLDEIVDKLKKQ